MPSSKRVTGMEFGTRMGRIEQQCPGSSWSCWQCLRAQLDQGCRGGTAKAFLSCVALIFQWGTWWKGSAIKRSAPDIQWTHKDHWVIYFTCENMQLGKPAATPSRSWYLFLSMRENRNFSGMKFSKYLFVSLSLHVRCQRRIFVLPQDIWTSLLLISLSHKNVGPHYALNIPSSLKARCNWTLEKTCKKKVIKVRSGQKYGNLLWIWHIWQNLPFLDFSSDHM